MTSVVFNVNGNPVEISLNDLPPVEQTKELLEYDMPPANTWRRIAALYKKQPGVDERQRNRNFETLIQSGLAKWMSRVTDSKALGDTDAAMAQAVIFNAAFAVHHYDISSRQSELDRERFMAHTQKYIDQGFQMEPLNHTLHAVTGLQAILGGNYSGAEEPLKVQQASKEKSEPIQLFGQGVLYYNTGRFREALECFSRLLIINPERTPIMLRHAIAMCWYKRKDKGKTRRALQRILELDDQNVTALVNLALLELEKGETANVQQAAQDIRKAYEMDKAHPAVLNYLAEQFLQQAVGAAVGPDVYQKVERLSMKCIEVAKEERSRATAYYNIGCVKHLQGEFEDAQSNYQRAVASLPAFPQALYGLAQTFLATERYGEAIGALKKAAEIVPEDHQVMMLLGQTYILNDQEKQARDVIEKMAKSKLPPEVGIVAYKYLGFLRRHDNNGAMAAYAQAVKYYEILKRPIPAAMHINIGVLHHQAGDYEGAHGYYTEAMETLKNDENPWQYTTVQYNFARLQEDQRNFVEARALYKEVLQKEPHNIPCHLSLARLKLKQGNTEGAEKRLKKAIQIVESSEDAAEWKAEPYVMLGTVQLEARELMEAQKNFYHVTDQLKIQDAHAALGLGFVALRDSIAYAASNPQLASDNAKRALRQFEKVIKSGGALAVSAWSGIGCLFAQARNYSDAHTVFAKASESASLAKEGRREVMLLNLANADLLKGQYTQAAKTYQTILRRYPETAAEYNIFALLGQAYFFAGEFEHASSALQTALALDPDNDKLRFNIAQCQLMYAMQLLTNYVPHGDLEPSRITLRQQDFFTIETMSNLFTSSQGMFEALQHKGGINHFRGYCKKNITLCGHYSGKADLLHDFAQRKEEEQRELMENFSAVRSQIQQAEIDRRMEELQNQRKKEEEEMQAIREATDRKRQREEMFGGAPAEQQSKRRRNDEHAVGANSVYVGGEADDAGMYEGVATVPEGDEEGAEDEGEE